jgi:hypothetical protein
LDGLEIAAVELSSTMDSYGMTTCECSKEELDRTYKLHPVRSTSDHSDVRAGVEKAHAEFLNRGGTIKDQCIGKVM